MNLPPFFELRHITKSFPNVVALNDLSLDIGAGEIHVVLGELGAGKTTLLRVLAGLYPAGSFAGELRLDAQPLLLHSPADAIHAGIGVVPRRLGIFDQLSVAENIVMGRWEHQNRFFIRSSEVQKQAQAVLDLLQFRLPIEARAAQLNPGQQRLLMIARAMSTHPRLAVLDEPATNVTTPEAISRLFHAVRRISSLGIACLYLTRRLHEAVQLGDRVSILRDGAIVATYQREGFDEAEMARAMISERVGDVEQVDVDEREDEGPTGVLRNLFFGRR